MSTRFDRRPSSAQLAARRTSSARRPSTATFTKSLSRKGSKKAPPLPVANATVGEEVYALHKKEGWRRAKVLALHDNGDVDVECYGLKWTVAAKDCLLLSSVAPTGVPDMIALDVLHEGAILENIEVRFARKEIYTYVGPILVSVNPYEYFKGMYNAETIRLFMGGLRETVPHVFGVGDKVYRDMFETGHNQSVIVTGESGAGKTEATKLVLEYLTHKSDKGSSSLSAKISRMLLDANPILEAFGNAKTVRNNNSSRYGKLLQVEYSADGEIIGGELIDYLLEKTRVVQQSAGDRNYHIFYQLLLGAGPAALKKYHLEADPTKYKILTGGGDLTVDGMDDREEYKAVTKAFGSLGFKDEEVEGLWRVLAVILHLGNIAFEMADSRQSAAGSMVGPKSGDDLMRAAELLNVTKKDLEDSMCIRTMSTSRPGSKRAGTTYRLPVEPEKCLESCRSLAKALYALTFTWLISRINTATKTQGIALMNIALLDIFGFEVFKTNSFEQLCINYTNESLNQQFIHHFFKLEEEEYLKEGVQIGDITFTDNAPCLRLISGKLGIFTLMEEQCKLPKATDMTLSDRLKTQFRDHSQFDFDKRNPVGFVIGHYAGKVAYDATGFLKKNKDTLIQDLRHVVEDAAQRDHFLRQVLRAGDGGGSDKATIGTVFKGQVQKLMKLLNQTQPCYIRCIKPNEQKRANSFSSALVLKQLSYSGVLDSIRIRQAGYAIRRPFDDINNRLGSHPLVRKHANTGPQGLCRAIVVESGIRDEEYLMGKTKVFFKTVANFQMYLGFVDGIRRDAAVLIQSRVRARNERRNFKVKLAATRKINACILMYVARRRFQRFRKKVIYLQSVVRRRLAYLEVQRLKEELRSGVTQEQKRAAVTIQAGYRGFMTRKLCAKLKEIKAMFATLQAASDKVRTEGWAFKKGGQKGHRRNWNERYFKLSGGGLAYFADREMTQQKGWIDLATLDGTELVKRSSQHFTTPEMKQRHMKATQECLELKRDSAMLPPFVMTATEPALLGEWAAAIELYSKLRGVPAADPRAIGLGQVKEFEGMLPELEQVLASISNLELGSSENT